MNSKSVVTMFLWFLSVVIVFLGGFVLGKVNIYGAIEPSGYRITGDTKDTYSEVDVNLLWEVWSNLENEYIDEMDGNDLLYGAAEGMVRGLDDPYTNFLNPEATQEYNSSNKGEFEGIGTTLVLEDEYVIVESPIEGAPAAKAGLQSGDAILKVDGVEMRGLSVYEVAANIRGEAGTSVTLSLYRASNNEEFDVEIVREKIDIDNIVYEDLGDGIYEIKIYKFTEESVEAFNKQWDNVVEDVLQQNPKGIVIDLTNNPGGYVSAVEYVLGEFLPKGSVSFKEEDKYGNQEEYKVSRTGAMLDIPMVVKVNSGSASASEIFAAAIQDHDRGEVVGQATAGKGVEQKKINLSDGSTLLVVFQRWLTPNGKNISKDDPIQPDTMVEEVKDIHDIAMEELKKKLN